jgi:hypothetical protein
MGDGNLTVGLIIDSAASPEQAEAIGAIATGQAGGPLAALGPLIGKMAGLERQPITFEMNGMTRSSRAGDLVEQVCEGLPGGHADEPMSLDNTPHPIASRLALAKAIRSKFQAFGIRWDDSTGTRNGHFAPFAWSG